MTTDGLFDDDDVWRPILEGGFGAVDMEAAGVAEVCEAATGSTGRSIAASVTDPTSTSSTKPSSA